MKEQRGISLATTPSPKMYEVPLDDGTVWTGTRRQLLSKHPDWVDYAREVQPPTRSTRAPAKDYEDVQTMIEQVEQDFENEQAYTRMPTSARKLNPIPGQQGTKRYQFHPDQEQHTIPPRRSTAMPSVAGAPSRTEDIPQTNAPRRKRGFLFFKRPKHPMLYFGVGMIAAIALWQLLTSGVSWYSNWQDDQHYGRPRTYQIDQVVGHNDSQAHPSHFIALNLDAHIIIIELPGGDVSKSVIYNGQTLYGQGADLAPITLTFQDITGDGKLDMIVHFQGSEIIYLNQNGKFVPQQQQ